MSAAKKYVHKSHLLEVVEVTDKNLEDLAKEHGGLVHTSVRTEGLRFLTMEPDQGTVRVNPGDYLLKHPDGRLEAMAEQQFKQDYVKV